jgi:hypothetical protein
MDVALRLSGSAASLLGVLFQLGVVTATIPELRRCPGCRLAGGVAPPQPQAVDTWRPFIENPGAGLVEGRQEPRCPEPRGTRDFYDLTATPLPDGYDPHEYGEKRIYACVLVKGDGQVLGARMLRGTGRAVRDGNLVWTIRLRWEFRPSYPAAEVPSWQRVRLSSGAVDGSVWYPPLLF